MKSFPLLSGCLSLLLLLGSHTSLADYPIEVIELKARPLEDILPVIQPLVAPDGTVTGMGNNLVIKAAPAKVREVKQLLREIDRPPRRLMITVNTQGESARSASGYDANADIRVDNGQISINSPGYPVDETRGRVRLRDTQQQRSRRGGQQVQALEGRPAFIASGTQVPVQEVDRYSSGGRIYERRVTTLQDASSGFYVVPRVQGERVTLEIRQRDDRPDRRRGVIHTQSSDTVVSGRLGEWISLGGINTSDNSRTHGLGHSSATQESAVRQIEVLVECLDCADRIEPYRQFLPKMDGFGRIPQQ